MDKSNARAGVQGVELDDRVCISETAGFKGSTGGNGETAAGLCGCGGGVRFVKVPKMDEVTRFLETPLRASLVEASEVVEGMVLDCDDGVRVSSSSDIESVGYLMLPN